MSTMVSRRTFCALAPAAAAALSAPHALAAPDDSHLLDLCRRHIDLEPVLADLWDRHVAAWDRTVAVIGECPKSGPQIEEWNDRLRASEAWQTEEEHDAVADQQCKLMDEIVRTDALTIRGVAAKLDLWMRTDHDYIGGNTVLWNSAAFDIHALCGFEITEQPEG